MELVPQQPAIRYDSTGQAFRKVGERKVVLEADATGIGAKGDTITVDDWKLVPELNIDPKTGQPKPGLNSMASNRSIPTL
jgi:hypothetical protein